MDTQTPQQALEPGSPRRLYPLPDACSQLGIGRSKLYELIDAGELRTVTIGRRRLVTASELDRFVAELTNGGTDAAA